MEKSERWTICKWCENASLFPAAKAKAYLYAKQTGAVNEIPPFEEVANFSIGEVTAEIETLEDYLVAVTISIPEHDWFYIFEEGELVTVID